MLKVTEHLHLTQDGSEYDCCYYLPHCEDPLSYDISKSTLEEDHDI